MRMWHFRTASPVYPKLDVPALATLRCAQVLHVISSNRRIIKGWHGLGTIVLLGHHRLQISGGYLRKPSTFSEHLVSSRRLPAPLRLRSHRSRGLTTCVRRDQAKFCYAPREKTVFFSLEGSKVCTSKGLYPFAKIFCKNPQAHRLINGQITTFLYRKRPNRLFLFSRGALSST